LAAPPKRGGITMGEGVSLDLTHGFNRLVDSWFDLFQANTAVDMGSNVACAYPTEASVADIWNNAAPTWYSLRWNQKAVPTDSIWLTRRLLVELEWDLIVHWQGLDYVHDGTAYQFIENCTASCKLVNDASLNLAVQAHFGHPNFYGGVASLPVTFHVKVDDSGTVIRDETKPFVIYGSGQRERLF
jgi:hypothetical protein